MSLCSCPKSRWSVGRSMRVLLGHPTTQHARTSCYMYLASICLLPPHPQMKVVWGDHLCPHAFSSQLSWRREYKIPTYNKPSRRDGKDKKKFNKRGVESSAVPQQTARLESHEADSAHACCQLCTCAGLRSHLLY